MTAAATFMPTVGQAREAGFFPSRHTVEIVDNRMLADGVYRLTFRDEFIAGHAKPAQFVDVYSNNPSRLMPRPFGVAEVDGDEVSLIFAVVGKGTAEFSELRAGDTIRVMGPLGNSFNTKENANYVLVAGGLGVPPLVRAAQAIAESEGSTSTAVFGYRNVRFGDGYVGRYADKTYSIDESEGNVVTLLDRIENELVNGELKPVVLSCGPLPMMKAVAAWAAKRGTAELGTAHGLRIRHMRAVHRRHRRRTIEGLLGRTCVHPRTIGMGGVSMTAEQHANLYEQHEWKHPTQVAGIPWKNPVATASGTFQYAAVRWFYDVSQLGAVTTKGVSPVPWEGNPGIRTAEGPSSNINAVGLQNPGVDHYLEDDLPKLKAINATVIANVAGHCDDDYAEVVSKLDDSPADMLEINVSCPNVSAGGMSVGTDPVALSRLITRLRKLTDKKMIVKLTPNVTDITVPARAAVESGADALSLINTLLGMRINIRTGEPVITHVTGGVSGPAVLPVGLAAVWRVRAALPEIPIIGIGGIDSGETALEYLYAGANAVEVGAAALFEPTAPLRVARELDDLLDERPELADKLAKGETWR